MAIRIRKIQTVNEYHACEALQQKVWRFKDREIIPINELITVQRNGGLVLGAFAPGGKLAGFLFGLPGLRGGRLIHCSRMLAVNPAYRGKAIGLSLKLAQRRFCLERGIDLAQWTFDPLQSLNAYFNIAKLGCIAREYVVNLYGCSSSVLNRGMETDRFVCEWWLRSPRVRHAMRSFPPSPSGLRRAGKDRAWEPRSAPSTGFPQALAAHLPERPRFHQGRAGEGSPPFPGRPRLWLRDKKLLVAIPTEIQRMKAAELPLARRWQRAVRKTMREYLGRGYVVTGFHTTARLSLGQYVLEKRPAGWVP